MGGMGRQGDPGPHHRTCPGHIRVSHTDLPPIVDWECTAFQDAGTISGWDGGPWDLRAYRDHRAASAAHVTFVISAKEHRLLLASDSLDIDEPALASSATWRRGRVELRGSLEEYESARETICEELELMPRGRMRGVLRGLAKRIQETLTISPHALKARQVECRLGLVRQSPREVNSGFTSSTSRESTAS